MLLSTYAKPPLPANKELTSYGLLPKKAYPEVAPRTEYSLTVAGERLVKIISSIRDLDEEMNNAEQ